MEDGRDNAARKQGSISSAKSISSKTEQTRELVDTLVSYCREVTREKQGGRFNSASKRVRNPMKDLGLYQSWLADAHLYFSEASNLKLSLIYASEWVLDNYYIIRQSLKQIEEDLPSGFYRNLPKQKTGPFKDLPRTYAIACSVLSFQNLSFDEVDLKTVLIRFQERVPLTTGELWALPVFLRFSLIETLAQELVTVIDPASTPRLPPRHLHCPALAPH